MRKQDNSTDVKKHLLNIRKNCGLRKCAEEIWKHNVSERPGGENGARKHGARENAMVHNTAGSRTDAAGSRANTTGSRANTTGSQPHRHGRKPHKRREWRARPCATQSGGLDSWTSCLEYTQMRRWKFPTSHQNWTTSSQVSPKAALATLPLWKHPKQSYYHDICEGAQVGPSPWPQVFILCICLFITDK